MPGKESISIKHAFGLLEVAKMQLDGKMITLHVFRNLARERYGNADEQSMNRVAVDVLLVLAEEARRLRDRAKWRPISEIHEDYSLCVLIDINGPGGATVGSCMDTDWDESQWTHFAQMPELTNEEAERLIAEMK